MLKLTGLLVKNRKKKNLEDGIILVDWHSLDFSQATAFVMSCSLYKYNVKSIPDFLSYLHFDFIDKCQI